MKLQIERPYADASAGKFDALITLKVHLAEPEIPSLT